MARTQQVVNSFASGVMSPRLTLRSDSDKYRAGLQEAVNFIVSPQGGITMRQGFENFGLISYPSSDNRIFTFHLGGDVSDLLVDITAGDSLIHYRVDGVIQTSLDADNGHNYLQTQLENLYFTNRQSLGILCHGNHPPYYIKQNYLGEITGKYVLFSQVPYVLYDDDKAPSKINNVTDRIWTISFSGTWTQGDAYNIIYGPHGVLVDGELANEVAIAYYFSTEAANIEEITFHLKNNYYLDSPESEVEVTTGDNVNFTVTLKGRGTVYNLTTAVVDLTASQDVNAVPDTPPITNAKEPAWSYPFTIEIIQTPGDGLTHYYKCIQSHQADTDSHPITGTDATLYWEDSGTVKPIGFDWQHTNGSVWEDGAYYAPWDRGFPTVAVFYQQRLLLMSAKDAGTGIWGSRIGAYDYFHLGPNDNDPFYFDLDTSDSPDIRWAESQRRLVIGTSSGDYVLTAVVTLSPSDIQATKQNAARSHATAAVAINTDIFYIEQGKEKIRTTGYSDDLQSQTSKDISLLAEHLMVERVKRLVLMQTPEVVMFGLREDGTLVCISFAPEQGVGAWYEFETQGRIIDIATAYTTKGGVDEDELWASVTYDGGLTRHIEKMPYPNRNLKARINETDQTLIDQGIICMDGWITGSMETGDNNVISGLEQFEGLLVAAMVDDAWAGEYTVKDGKIILEVPASGDVDPFSGTWAVGMRFTARAKTFEMAGGNQRGTGFGTRRRWNKLYVRLLDSAMPVISGTLPPDRTPATSMGIPEIIRQDLQDVVIRNMGWDDGAITIVQDRPYPTHVLGCYGEFNSENA